MASEDRLLDEIENDEQKKETLQVAPKATQGVVEEQKDEKIEDFPKVP